MSLGAGSRSRRHGERPRGETFIGLREGEARLGLRAGGAEAEVERRRCPDLHRDLEHEVRLLRGSGWRGRPTRSEEREVLRLRRADELPGTGGAMAEELDDAICCLTCINLEPSSSVSSFVTARRSLVAITQAAQEGHRVRHVALEPQRLRPYLDDSEIRRNGEMRLRRDVSMLDFLADRVPLALIRRFDDRGAVGDVKGLDRSRPLHPLLESCTRGILGTR